MPFDVQQFGSVTVARVRNSADLRRLLSGSWLDSDVFVVKPNWFSPHPANFTDSETLGMLLDVLNGRTVVTEAYTLSRQDGSMKFTVDGEEVDWRWITKHPSWEWVKKAGCWDKFREQDKWFLDEHGFTDLFNERGAEYINVTEEVWQGNTADAGKIKEAVEARFPPVFREELYGCLPQKLFELRGATLISLGRIKGIGGTYPSLTMKNMFGLIPDPLRSWWHGPGDEWLATSIVDINKVYMSLFNVYGLCEAIRYATLDRPDGDVKVPWGSYSVAKDLGVAAFGRHLVSLDAVLCCLIGINPDEIPYLRIGQKVFGAYDIRHVAEAKAAAAYWFPV